MFNADCIQYVLLFRYSTQWKKYVEDWISAQERLCCCCRSIVKAVGEPVPVPFCMHSAVCILIVHSVCSSTSAVLYVTVPFVLQQLWYCRSFVDVTLINEIYQWKKLVRRDATKKNILVWKIEFLHREDCVQSWAYLNKQDWLCSYPEWGIEGGTSAQEWIVNHSDRLVPNLERLTFHKYDLASTSRMFSVTLISTGGGKIKSTIPLSSLSQKKKKT